MAAPPPSIADIQTWFKERGFGLEFRAADGRYWADLVSLRTQSVFAPRYGVGDTEATAANSAKVRYEQEQ
jgi:hypothetical protein